MANAALLRRRIRDPALTLERHQVGGRSQTDVALVYMKGEANEQHLRQLRQKLDSIDVRSIAMSSGIHRGVYRSQAVVEPISENSLY